MGKFVFGVRPLVLLAVVFACTGSPPANDGGIDGSDPNPQPCTGDCRDKGQACQTGSECVTGFCADGVCCDTACGGSQNDCQACSNALNGRADGVCAPFPSGRECRSSSGPCDFAEVCDGVSGACPGNVFIPAGLPCRPAAGPCDVSEVCTGSDAQCPTDAKAGTGIVCRASRGACDLADKCDGQSAECLETFAPPTTLCRAGVGICDAPDYCTGSSVECPQTFVSGVECRASSGGCDISEFCSGTDPDCPPNDVLPAGIVCRPAIRTQVLCDPVEQCDGTSTHCPADVEFCP